MKKGSIELHIVSLKDVVFHDYVDSVTLPTKAGEITVLPNHIPLISHLSKGAIRTKFEGQERSFQIENGFLEVSSGNRLSILLS